MKLISMEPTDGVHSCSFVILGDSICFDHMKSLNIAVASHLENKGEVAVLALGISAACYRHDVS